MSYPFVIMSFMILVTGATGFIGSHVVRRLVELNESVRLLIRPTAQSPNLPRSIPVEIAVSTLHDEKGMRSAMKGVRAIVHLASAEHEGVKADLDAVDILGTQTLIEAASLAGVEHIIYLSHIGADRFSAYPLLKAKAIAEGFIQRGDVPYTIIRSAVINGRGDHFTVSFAQILRMAPGVFVMPGDGSSLLQPVFIDDVITCILLCLETPSYQNQVLTIGGSETYQFGQIIDMIMHQIGVQRRIISIAPPYLRAIALLLEQGKRPFPLSIYWLDYLAADRTCALDSMPRLFGLMPTRFSHSLDYLTA